MVAYLSKSEIISRLEERHPGSTSGSYPPPRGDYFAGWFCQFEQDLRECNIPPAQYQTTALMVLLGTIRVGMMIKRRQEPCTWDVFKNVIVEAVCHLYLLDTNAKTEIFELTKRLEDRYPGCTFGRYLVPKSNAMEEWFQQFEADFEECNIPSHLRHYAACLVLPAYTQKTLLGKPHWDQLSWTNFKLVLTEIIGGDENSDLLSKAAAVVGGASLVAMGGAVLLPAVVIGGLNVVGFGAGGVVGGSLAASIQSGLYGGMTGGLFSLCQSVAATSVLPAAGAIISAAGATVAGKALIGAALESSGDDTAAPRRRLIQDSFTDKSDQEEVSDFPCLDETFDNDELESPRQEDYTSVALPPFSTLNNANSIIIGPINWGNEITEEFYALLGVIPNCQDLANRRIRVRRVIDRENYVHVEFPSQIDLATFTNNWMSTRPPEYMNVHITL